MWRWRVVGSEVLLGKTSFVTEFLLDGSLFLSLSTLILSIPLYTPLIQKVFSTIMLSNPVKLAAPTNSTHESSHDNLYTSLSHLHERKAHHNPNDLNLTLFTH